MIMWHVLSAHAIFAFDRQDSLRGGNGRGRSWWDVEQYNLDIIFDTTNKSIQGDVTVWSKIITAPCDSLQLDLQEPMMLDSVKMDGKCLEYSREGNAWWVKYPFHELAVGADLKFTAFYHGKPRIAKNPPWDGGFIWTKDSTGKPWIAVACQGLGASSWWPCKDYQGDEPDSGLSVLSYKNADLRKIYNGSSIITHGHGGKVMLLGDGGMPIDSADYIEDWNVRNPINTYNVTFYIGDYIDWRDTLMGEKGKLDLAFHVLRYNEAKARKHFAVTKQMLHCFEYWMGPYPFYEDGYKLVEAPYLGMEHQSAVAYGNKYQMGYKGTDRSGTGVGMLFDFIIVHESGHEWFGNNITAQDVADNWLHEGFTTYTEALFAECAFGKEKAFQYTIGEWKNIRNDKPIIGTYGVHNDGSGDKYDKGSAVVHMIRMVMNDDEKFRQLLRGLNKDFYHQIVTSAQVEEYINKFAGYDFTPLFNQYLRTTNIPKLEWYVKKQELIYKFKDVVEGFSLPLEITSGKIKEKLTITSEWQHMKWKKGFDMSFQEGFLIKQ